VVSLLWYFGALRAQVGPGYHLEGSVSLAVPVSGLKMTNLVFPVAVAPAVKVSRDILMQRPKGVENVVMLKAVRRNFPATNIAVFGRDGRLYSFNLFYVEDTAVLTFRVVVDGPVASGLAADRSVIFTGLPVDGVKLDSDAVMLAARRRFLKGSVSAAGVRLRLKGFYLRDGLLWMCLRVEDRVQVGFTPSYMRVFIEDKKKVKRTASQDVVLLPVYPARLGPVAGDGSVSVAAGFVPFALARGKRLVVEMADEAGGRVLVLRVKGKKVLKAKEVH